MDGSASTATSLLQMAQLLVDAGVDSTEDDHLSKLFSIHNPSDVENVITMTRMILHHSQSDPLHRALWNSVPQDMKALIVEQEEWGHHRSTGRLRRCQW